MDGMTVLRAIRGGARFADVSVIVVTAKDLTSNEVRHLETEVAAIVRNSGELGADLKRTVHRLLVLGPGADPTRSHPPPRRPA